MASAEDDVIAHELIIRAIRLNRFTASQRAQIFELMKEMEDELILQLQRADLSDIGRRDRANLLRQAREVIDQYYGEISDTVGSTLTDLGRAEAKFMADTISSAFQAQIAVSLPTEGYFQSLLKDTLIQGAPSKDWWVRQAGDTAFRFANAVRQGLVMAETNDQIIKRVMTTNGLLDGIPRRNAAALVQTSVQQVASDARRATFEQNDDITKGIRQLSTLDSKTSQICVAYSGAEWDNERKPIRPTKLPYNNGVPRHWNCRSTEVPITKTYKELGIDAPEKPVGQRASQIGPISADTTMADFIRMRGRGFADELLGIGKADLFLSGKITLQQLLDQSGRPLTLEELQKLYD
jgi:hypothetical protein